MIKKVKMQRGIIITYVLVFGGIFILLLSSLLGFILLQLKQSARNLAYTEALEIAEAGIDYYKWCLNNDVEGDCVMEKDYLDKNGSGIGHFSLNVNSLLFCGESNQVIIDSIGWTNAFPELKRQVEVIYARTSVAKYMYLLNSNVWAGPDRIINGLYHSNGGIRMDGENRSLVTSASPNWNCTSSFGCDYNNCPDDCTRSGTVCRCPGVFTTTENANPSLFDSPVPSFDFDSITVDLAHVKDIADDNPYEYYWPPAVGINSSADGYHIKIKNNNTVEVWIITRLQRDPNVYSEEEGDHVEYIRIIQEYLYDTITIDPSCAVLFFEDNIWLEGELDGKLTIVSADLINPTKETSVVLLNNITYADSDGTDGFSVIAENNVLISPDAPQNLNIYGIFIAQNGRFGMNLYRNLHASLKLKGTLRIYGSIVSNGRVGTSWVSGSTIVGGFSSREAYSDQNLIYSPPPFVPYITSDFKIINWEEIE